MAVVDGASGEVVAEAERVHPAGFFVARLEGRTEPFPYRLRVSGTARRTSSTMSFRFQPVLGDLDMHLLAEGSHLDSHQKLGAHRIDA